MTPQTNKSFSGAPTDATEWVVTQLEWVAKTGVVPVKLGDPAITTLAEKIAALVAENDYLKKIMDARVLVKVDDAKISIAFGPGYRFSLDIPVNSVEEKKAVANAMLLSAAQILQDANKPASSN